MLNQKINLLLTALLLLLVSMQVSSNVVFTLIPANPSAAGTPLILSWIHDCVEGVEINYGDGNSDFFATGNSTTHTYASAGVYSVALSGATCNTAGTMDFITVFIEASSGPGPGPGPGPVIPTQVTLDRLQLFFDNRLPKITVARNKTNLRAHASIRYSGSGLFQATWEVDGRIIERIDRHLLDGGTLQLSTPEYVQLPTFISGPHTVRLVVTAPSISPAALPKAVYFVTEQGVVSSKLELIAPANNSVTSAAENLDFRWFSIPQSPKYLLKIFDNNTAESVFSAYANQQKYTFKKPLIENFLREDKRYRWQVSALDSGGKIISSSEKNTFRVNKKTWAVEHQFLLIVDDSLLGHSVKKQMINKLQLDVIEEFSLKSLSQAVVVFQTQRESNQLLNDLQRNKDVIGAQPDYIYRAATEHNGSSQTTDTVEPLQDLQLLARLLDFKLIHPKMTGMGSSIAVIDTGVEVHHPDLIDARIITQNLIKDESYQGEIHGTAIIGIIAAQRNSVGIIGIAPQTKILALRACRQLQPGLADAECYSSALAKALDKAMIEKVQLVNFSFGTPAKDPLISNLLNHSHEQGILLIASAGNDSRQQALSFPASHGFVISVAGKDGQQLFPSNLVADQADILAPSEQVFTTVSDGRHNFLNGTSMSSAIVAGIVSLGLQQASPAELDLKLNGQNFCDWVNSTLNIPACRDSQ